MLATYYSYLQFSNFFSRDIIIMIISNGNRTDLSWSPIWSVIIQVINKIGPPRSSSLMCLIMNMNTDQNWTTPSSVIN